MSRQDGPPTVAIVGGGFSGAAIAFHLARLLPRGGVRIVVFEPRARLGAGLAYDTADPVHRINVPAVRMSLVPGDETHFLRWLQQDGCLDADEDAKRPDGSVFPRRSVFGRYVADHLQPLLDSGRVEHVQERVGSVVREDDHWILRTAKGRRFLADRVVIATSHPPPSPPSVLTAALARDGRFIADPHAPDALAGIGSQARVLIVGTGLTMADIVASLHARGHRGKITAISRRGQRSRGHAAQTSPPFGDFTTAPARTAQSLIRRVRETVREAAKVGLGWQPVLDAVRQQGRAIWTALPEAERRRLVRHGRPFWDTHRFRIAPQVHAVLEDGLREGRLEILAASVTQAATADNALMVTLRRRGAGASELRPFDAVIVTTGPAHGALLRREAYLSGLSSAGWLRADGVGLGIACDTRARALDREGRPVSSLFIGGPLARATFGELMGLPEVSEFARFVAQQVAEALVGTLGWAENLPGETSFGADAKSRTVACLSDAQTAL